MTSDPNFATFRDEPSDMNLLALWRLIKSRVLFIGGVTVFMMLVGVTLKSIGTSTYTAETVLVLEDQNTSLTSVSLGDRNSLDDPTSVVEIFGSRPVIERVVDELDLMNVPEFNRFLSNDATSATFNSDLARQSTLNATQRKVRFLSNPSSKVIRVVTRTTDPHMSVKLANTAADAFLTDLFESNQNASDRIIHQLSGRVTELKRQSNQAQTALRQFINDNETPDPDQLEALGDEVGRLRTRLRQASLKTAKEERILVELTQLRTQSLTDIQASLYGSSEMAAWVGQLGQSPNPQRAIDTAVDKLNVEIENSKTYQQSLKNSLNRLETSISTQSEQLLHLQQLQHDAEASKDIYELSVRRLNELSLEKGIETNAGRILFSAEIPHIEDGRGRKRTGFILGVLGLFTALTFVLIREATNETIRKASDLRKLSPTSSIVSLPTPSFNEKDTLRATAKLLQLTEESNGFADALRALRSELLSRKSEAAPLMVQTTADVPSAMQTALTISLARSCVMIGQRVLIIDADTRERSLVSSLNLPHQDQGLLAALNEPEASETVTQTHPEFGFDVLSAERTINHASDVFEKKGAFVRYLKSLTDRYDLILVNTPALDGSHQLKSVSQHAACTILMVKAGKTTLTTVNHAVSELPNGMSSQDIFVLHNASSVQSKRRSSNLVQTTAQNQL